MLSDIASIVTIYLFLKGFFLKVLRKKRGPAMGLFISVVFAVVVRPNIERQRKNGND